MQHSAIGSDETRRPPPAGVAAPVVVALAAVLGAPVPVVLGVAALAVVAVVLLGRSGPVAGAGDPEVVAP